MSSSARPLLPTAAAVALVLGIGSAAWVAAGTRAALLSLARPHLDLRLLREMAAPLGEPAAARRLYEQAEAPRGTAADYLRAARPDWAALLKEEAVIPAEPGWAVRQAKLEGGPLPMADVAALLESAENQRPPWRVAQVAVEPVGTGAVVRAALTLERLERAGS